MFCIPLHSFFFYIIVIICYFWLRVENLLIEQEKLILNTLQFNMSVPTPYVFMKRFLKAADADKQVKYH
jgi:hypothetical protein